jgi:hypothetical protein
VVLLDYDGTVFFYDSATGHEFRRVTGIAPYALLVFSPNGRTFATVEGLKYQSNQVRVWETVSGTVRHQFPGPEGGLFALAFAPDSCRLATGGGDTTILVWDLIRGTEAPSRQGRPSVDEWEKIWAQLGAPEARVGHQAMCRMLDAPETAVGFLKTRLKGQLEPAQRLARALEVLEWIDTAQTRELLQSWAQRYPDTALGQAARETFDRLARRPVRQASNK